MSMDPQEVKAWVTIVWYFRKLKMLCLMELPAGMGEEMLGGLQLCNALL